MEEFVVEFFIVFVVELVFLVVKCKVELEEFEVNFEVLELFLKCVCRVFKKGKFLFMKVVSDDENDDEDEEGGKKGKERLEYGVWIGNLLFFVFVFGLKKWFVDNLGGVIVEEVIIRVKIFKKKEFG